MYTFFSIAHSLLHALTTAPRASWQPGRRRALPIDRLASSTRPGGVPRIPPRRRYALSKACTAYFFDRESRRQNGGVVAGCVGAACFHYTHIICAVAALVAALSMCAVAWRARPRYGALRREAARDARAAEELACVAA